MRLNSRFSMLLGLSFALFNASPAEARTMIYPNGTTVIHEQSSDWANAQFWNTEVKGKALMLKETGLVKEAGLVAEAGAAVTGGTLTSAPIAVAPFNELVPSWNAATPSAGSIAVEVRAQVGTTWTRWFSFGKWASTGVRGSIDGQKDALGEVMTDTLRLSQKATAYQYRLTLWGAGTQLKLVAFNTTDRSKRLAFAHALSDKKAWGKLISVPQRSQMIYPNGGEVWCSPTSVSMIMAHHGVSVTVPQAAAGTLDSVYEGTGNWAFNAAYAGSLGFRAFVTRLPSLSEAEKYISAGVPLAVSIGWKVGELPGAAIPSSTGHLVVLVGFDKVGNPIINDPAAPNNLGVRRPYPREIFEKLWLSHSGGLSYVIAPQGKVLP